ncbi:MAG: hypothetical protein IJG59_06370 [Erysipelotrichaceae bacterium]|nr:hypothetical protein [Erysipelotrichaceae bacterium]
MRKIIVSVLSAMLLFSGFCSIIYAEDEYWVEITEDKEVILHNRNGLSVITSTNGDIVTVYNYDTGEKIETFVCSFEEHDIKPLDIEVLDGIFADFETRYNDSRETIRALYDNSTDWDPTWHQYRTGTVSVPSSATNELISALASVLLNKLLGPYATYVNNLITVATLLINYNVQFQYGNAYFVQYYRSNYHCYILSKTYASYYTNSSMGTYLGSSSVGHFWSATPWNYYYPAPCRTLVNTYPA